MAYDSSNLGRFPGRVRLGWSRGCASGQTGTQLPLPLDARNTKNGGPKLGVLGPYTPANVEWAKQAGFTNMILRSGRRGSLDPDTVTDAQIETIKATLAKNNMHVSAFQVDGDHINPDPAREL